MHPHDRSLKQQHLLPRFHPPVFPGRPTQAKMDEMHQQRKKNRKALQLLRETQVHSNFSCSSDIVPHATGLCMLHLTACPMFPADPLVLPPQSFCFTRLALTFIVQPVSFPLAGHRVLQAAAASPQPAASYGGGGAVQPPNLIGLIFGHAPRHDGGGALVG